MAPLEHRGHLLRALLGRRGLLRDRRPARRRHLPPVHLLSRALRPACVWFGLALLGEPATAQSAPGASFRFSAEAGATLRALWEESVAARQERVACLAADIRGDTVFVQRVLRLEPDAADSMGVSATASIDQCGPPEWDGTVHTHVALYTDDSPSRRFSGQDRTVMRMWYHRWRSDGVFCVAYSERSAHCEADGVVGGMRSRPRYVH